MPLVEVNGISQYYELRGDPAAPPVLLVGGLGGAGTEWGEQVERFAAEFQVILPDQRGTGRSSRPATGYTTRQLAGDLAALLTHLGTGPVHYVGASTGAAIGQYLALDHPELVATLSMAGAFACLDAFAARQNRARRAVVAGLDRRARCDVDASWLFSQQFTRAHPELVSAWIDDVLAVPETPDDRAAAVRRVDMIGAHDTRSRLAEITVPCLVVVGQDDVAVGVPVARDLADGLPDSRFLVRPDAGHLVAREKADDFHRLVCGFITDQSTGCRSPRPAGAVGADQADAG